jgi:2-oxoglutarate ferredoxin oxidoreductase subunit delta
MSYIKIDKKRCKACYLCIKECPKKLIVISTEANSMGHFPVEFKDPENECIGCAMCATRCPDIAITEVCKTNNK